MEGKNASVEKKLNELIELLAHTNLDSDAAKNYRQQIDRAIEAATSYQQQIKPFEALDEDDNASRDELLDRMGILLSETRIDSNIAKKYNRRQQLQKIVLCMIATVIIVLGIAMIIMPAPPSFEIYTVFYFSENDGITIMDLVSLLIILCGVFLFITALNKQSGKS